MAKGSLVALFGVALIISAAVGRFSPPRPGLTTANLESNFHYSGFFEIKGLIEETVRATNQHPSDTCFTQLGITSHHLPTAISFISQFYKVLKTSKGPRETFIILGPDHFERCLSNVATSKKPYLTPFGEVTVDEEIIDNLLSAGVYLDNNCLEGEHSVGIQTIFIKYLFPQAKVVPLIFSASTQDNQIKGLADVLEDYKDKITVVCSVDFSHSYPKEQAEDLDRTSEQMLKNLDSSGFHLEYVDSPPAIKLTIALAKRFQQIKTVIFSRANSADFNHNPKSTTGYINTFFVP